MKPISTIKQLRKMMQFGL